jgi:hypothetical protein
MDWLYLSLGNPQINPSKMVWLGGPGVTAQTHYDSSYNFFIQLFGVRKSFHKKKN